MGYSVGLPKGGLNGMEFNAERGGPKAEFGCRIEGLTR